MLPNSKLKKRNSNIHGMLFALKFEIHVASNVTTCYKAALKRYKVYLKR